MNKWDIYLADVPFEDTPESKIRPILILGTCAVLIDCLKMTSHPARLGEYTLQKWSEAGLRKPTTVRFSKRLQLRQQCLRKKLGHLHPIDIFEIEKRISSF